MLKNKEIKKKLINKISETLNFKKQSLHEPILGEIETKYLNKCIKSGFVSSAGKMIGQFEDEIKKITKSNYAISVINGTEAIKISLIVSGVKKNNEVLVPSLTFVGSVSPIVQIGSIPHFIDSNIETLGVDYTKLKSYLLKNTFIKNKKTINKKTGRIIKAIIPVHIFGHPCEIDKIIKLCKSYNILVLEDAAEALGSYYKGRHLGTYGLAGCLSFNGNKIITTGSGGMIITNNKKFAVKAKHLIQTAKRPHPYEYIHDEIGYNSRMSNLNAALGIAQTKSLKKFLLIKRKILKMYSSKLKNISQVSLFLENKFSKSNYWLQTLILDDETKQLKNSILKSLNDKGIGARPAWRLISSLKPYKKFPKMDLKGAKKIYQKVINLPSGPGILSK
jgi:perosamine synthetase